ncbi:hypothetical protein A2Y99_02545 [Candidatus Gottesmanbacteria bacterium RBG_13_37_7]|uniref:Uncharacterized protein n=1 Tax=Candidatus Gottesmanbacteria bacterium RBG_13_37_7 TaxID=1798369 RepID=A0A1F5YIN7_9BACT|nr:MAG: hypothetical protein A2Y99_02545 [Candidatus Gottesmanbacteria bacterium RBG_13_37_7]
MQIVFRKFRIAITRLKPKAVFKIPVFVLLILAAVSIFLISIIFFSGCRKPSGTEVPASTASVNITSVTSQNQNIPENFSTKLYWDTGSLPPAPDIWVAEFSVSSIKLNQLYEYLDGNGFFRDSWGKVEPSIGGSYYKINITANDKTYEIPPDFELNPEDSKKISEVADFVKNLVPENIWADMEKRQKEFEESFEN